MCKKLNDVHNSVEERMRLEKLYGYSAIDDYELSGTFKHVASLAARIFDVPLAFVNFVDRENVLIKASIGADGVESISREIGLCSLAIQQEEVTVIKNAKLDPLFFSNPIVHGDFGMQFYAGAPIRTPDGFNIGVVAVADRKPRHFTKEQEQLLEELASLVMEELEEWQSKK
jgi:GAF domain-containing protein